MSNQLKTQDSNHSNEKESKLILTEGKWNSEGKQSKQFGVVND